MLKEINPKSEKGKKYVEKFVTTPGVINSDRIVLQSETMKQIYLDILEDWLGKETCKEQRFADRIVASDSPKIDKLKRTELGGITIPDE